MWPFSFNVLLLTIEGCYFFSLSFGCSMRYKRVTTPWKLKRIVFVNRHFRWWNGKADERLMPVAATRAAKEPEICTCWRSWKLRWRKHPLRQVGLLDWQYKTAFLVWERGCWWEMCASWCCVCFCVSFVFAHLWSVWHMVLRLVCMVCGRLPLLDACAHPSMDPTRFVYLFVRVFFCTCLWLSWEMAL